MTFAAIKKSNTVPNPFLGIGEQLAQEQVEPFNAVLKIFDYLARPSYAVSGMATAIAKGKPEKMFSFAKKGFLAERRFNFDGVLKALGAPRGKTGIDLPFFGEVTTRGTVGLAMDILLDPLTYTGLLGLTKAGRAVPRGLSAVESEGVAAVREAGQKLMSGQQSRLTLKGRELAETKISHIQRFGKRTFDPTTGTFSKPSAAEKLFDVFEDTPGEFGFEIKSSLPDVIKGREHSRVMKSFRTEILPNLRKRFENELKLGTKSTGTKAGIFLQDKPLFANPIAAKAIKEKIGVAALLDEVFTLNQSSMQIIRNIEDANPLFRGATRAAAHKKGFVSTITFGGLPVIPNLGKLLGIPVPALQKMDRVAFEGLDLVFDKISTWPLVKQMKEMFAHKTGFPLLDEYLSKVRGTNQSVVRHIIQDKLKIAETAAIAAGKHPEQVHTMMREAIQAMEKMGHKYVDFDLYADLQPEVRELVDVMRQALDEDFIRRKASVRSLAGAEFNIEYLPGYFPRQLSAEVKDLFETVLSESSVKHGILLTHETRRKLHGTTGEINQLFRENKLAIAALEEGFRTNKKFRKRLEMLDSDTASLFVDDPVLAVANRLAAGVRVSSDREIMGGLLRLFGRPVGLHAHALGPNEVLVQPTGVFSVFDPGEFTGDIGKRKIDAEIKRILGLSANTNSEVIEHVKEAMLNLKAKDIARAEMTGISPKGASAAYKVWTEMSMYNPHMFAALTEQGATVWAVDSKVNDLINEMWTVRKNPATYNMAIKGYDALTTLFKRYTLAPFLEFHARNLMTDIGWLGLLGKVNPLKETMSPNGGYAKAVSVMMDTEFAPKNLFRGPKRILDYEGKIPGAGKTIRLNNGTELDLAKAYRDYISSGGTGGLLRDVEYAATTKTSHLNTSLKQFFEPGAKGFAKRSLNPFKPTFVPLQAGANLGNFLQMTTRFGFYLSKLKQGLPHDEAMMAMKKYLFDYSELTHFERNIMRRVIPFYTWLRNNIPLQMEMMIRRPGTFANLQKTLNAIGNPEIMDKIPPGGVPQFVRNEWGIPMREVKPGVYEFQLMGSFVPAADLVKLGSLPEIMRLGAKSLNPMLQVPLEQWGMINKNFFSGLPVENYPGEVGTFLNTAMPKKYINALRKVRILNTIDQFMREDPRDPYRRKQFTIKENILKIGTGIRPTRVEPEEIRKRLVFKSNLFASKLRSSLKKARKFNDPNMIRYLEDLLEESKSLSKGK